MFTWGKSGAALAFYIDGKEVGRVSGQMLVWMLQDVVAAIAAAGRERG